MDFEEYYSKTLPAKISERKLIVYNRMVELVSQTVSAITEKIQVAPPYWHRRVAFEDKEVIAWELAFRDLGGDAIEYYYLLPDGRIVKRGRLVPEFRQASDASEIDQGAWDDLSSLCSGILKSAEVNFGVELDPSWKEAGYLTVS